MERDIDSEGIHRGKREYLHSYVKVGTDTRLLLPQGQECLGPLEPGRDEKDPSWEVSGKHNSADILIWGKLGKRASRSYY